MTHNTSTANSHEYSAKQRKGEHRPTRNTYLPRRVGAVVLATVALLGAGEASNGIYDAVKSDAHLSEEMTNFSQPDSAHRLKEMGYSPKDVQSFTVPTGVPNPTELARLIGATDVAAVAYEISGQVGGDHSMNPGEKFVLPKDQLPPQQ